MEDSRSTEIFLWVFTLLLLVMGTCRGVTPVAGATLPREQLALARICAGEANLQLETNDCGAIYQVLTRRAEKRGRTFMQTARAYSTKHFDRERTDKRRWVAHLNLGGWKPDGWPQRLPWAKHAPRWDEILDYAGGLLRGTYPAPCAFAPDDWGNDGDLKRYRKYYPDFERVDCGYTLNHFVRRYPSEETDAGNHL